MFALRTSLRAVARPLVARVAQKQIPVAHMRVAFFSAAAGLDHEQVQSRILDVLKSFEKVDPAKLSTTASFAKDLGLDSLDAVEVVMAIEEEFGIEIPDADADAISTVQQAIEYISKTPEAH